MKTNLFFRKLFGLSFLIVPMIASAQVKVNEESNVGIKTDNTESLSLKIENQDNLKSLYSIYNYSGTEASPMNLHLSSTINSDFTFRGLYGSTVNEGTGLAYNLFSQISSASSGQVIGVYNRTLGFQSPQPNGSYSIKYGVFNQVEGQQSGTDSDEARTGIHSLTRGNGMGILTGVNNKVTGQGNGGRLGINNVIDGTGSGSRRGMMNYVYGYVDGPYNSSNTKYGLLNYVFGEENGTDSDDSRFGLYNRVYGNGNGTFQGTNNVVYGDGTGTKYGQVNSVYGNGDGEKIGTYNLVSGANDSNKKGIQNFVKGTGAGNKYGMFNYVFENGTGAYYGIYNYVFGDNGTSTKIGIYSRVNSVNSNNAYGVFAKVDGAGYAGYFAGDVHVTGNLTYNPSDRRLKHDIKPFGKTLDKLMKLNPVSYNYKTDRIPLPKEKQIGLIAQELELLFPDAVRESSFVIPSSKSPGPEEETEDLKTENYKVIDYNKLIPVLIKSVQEQQEIIKEQTQLIKEQQKLLLNVQQRLAKLESK